MNKFKTLLALILVIAISYPLYKYFTKPSATDIEVDASDALDGDKNRAKTSDDSKPEEKSSFLSLSSLFGKKGNEQKGSENANYSIPDFHSMTFEKEEMSEKRKKLQSVAEKFQKETMEKLEKVSNRDDLSPEEMMNLVYQDDPASYSPDKAFYLNEIAKPMLSEDDEDFADEELDMTRILSKAYDMIDTVAHDDVINASRSLAAIPKEIRQKANKELRNIQRSMAGKAPEELEEFFSDVQNNKSEQMDKLFEKIPEEYQNHMRVHILSSARLNALNK